MMDGTIYEEATWYDIENNKMHLKRDGESYVADAMLFRESINLRQENDSLKKENDSLRKERDHWHVEQIHAYGNWEDAHKRASELEAENAKLKRRLEILKAHGIEIVDAVAGGFEIYNKEHARADKLKAENEKLRDIAHDMWRLLLATGNDDLVLSIEASGVVKEVIDAEELAKTMRELGIEVY